MASVIIIIIIIIIIINVKWAELLGSCIVTFSESNHVGFEVMSSTFFRNVRTELSSMAAFLKLWSSGSALVVLLD